jgi:hypothetical protein
MTMADLQALEIANAIEARQSSRVLVGVLAIDDILKVTAGDAEDVVSTIRNERAIEGVARR